MREQLEIIIYQFKKKNNLDVYSKLSFQHEYDLGVQILEELERVNHITKLKNTEAK